MTNNVANNLTETFQNIFLAGVGALSIGGEKAKAVIDDLVERGQVTVDQGRKLNEELKHKAEDSVSKVRELTPEERIAFAEQMAQIAREREDDGIDDVVVEAEEVADDDDVVINPDGTYGGNDVDPVEHLDVEAHAEPSAGTADPGDVVINPDGTYGGNDVDPVEHLKGE